VSCHHDPVGVVGDPGVSGVYVEEEECREPKSCRNFQERVKARLEGNKEKEKVGRVCADESRSRSWKGRQRLQQCGTGQDALLHSSDNWVQLDKRMDGVGEGLW
jgi:hypothetical protein